MVDPLIGILMVMRVFGVLVPDIIGVVDDAMSVILTGNVGVVKVICLVVVLPAPSSVFTVSVTVLSKGSAGISQLHSPLLLVVVVQVCPVEAVSVIVVSAVLVPAMIGVA